jgi:hypothetical protein
MTTPTEAGLGGPLPCHGANSTETKQELERETRLELATSSLEG